MYEDEDSDCLDFGGDSDDDRVESESSEDELDVLLNATPEKRRQLQQERHEKKQPEDDFEREMNAELQETVAAIEAQREHTDIAGQGDPLETRAQKPSTSGDTSNSVKNGSTKYYDNIYFDSDDEENVQEEISIPNRKRPIPSNDDLLYDPNMDAEDEKWVTQQRQRCRPKDNQPKKKGQKTTGLPQSDAVLDCPACMTTLCRDCQRHDVYENQYRAMFVTNCVVDTSELLKFPEQKVKKKKRSKQDVGGESDNDKYNPVKCGECNTVVAMYDTDEIYHFFNVLASYS